MNWFDDTFTRLINHPTAAMVIILGALITLAIIGE